MVIMQNSDANLISCNSAVGNGEFLSPWTGGSYSNPYYRHNKNGNGIADLFKSGMDFFKNNSKTIADAATAAGGIANVIKTAKDIKRADEELYELKRIKDNSTQKTKTNFH